MAMSYHKIYKVPVWVVVNKTSKSKTAAVLDYFAERGARIQQWPANSYAETVKSYASKGWAHALPDGPYVLDTQLMLISSAAHTKSALGPTSYLGGSVSTPSHRIDRSVKTDKDLANIYNSLLDLEDPIALSQAFQVAEISHNESAYRTFKVWVTEGPVPESVIRKISDQVLTIGDDDTNNLVLKDVSKDKLTETLDEYFAKFAQN